MSDQMATSVTFKHWIELIFVFFVCLAGVFFGSRFVGQKWAEYPYLYQEVRIPKMPKVGDKFFTIDIRVNRTKLCANTFYREVYDGKGTRIDQFTWTRGPAPVGPEEYSINIPLPHNAQSGDLAKYCWSQAPKCNLIQTTIPYWSPMKCVPVQIQE